MGRLEIPENWDLRLHRRPSRDGAGMLVQELKGVTTIEGNWKIYRNYTCTKSLIQWFHIQEFILKICPHLQNNLGTRGFGIWCRIFKILITRNNTSVYHYRPDYINCCVSVCNGVPQSHSVCLECLQATTTLWQRAHLVHGFWFLNTTLH